MTLGLAVLWLAVGGCTASPSESTVQRPAAGGPEAAEAVPRSAPAAALPEPAVLPAERRAEPAPKGGAESSVRPGINAPYFETGALEKYTRILERETREVVAQLEPIVAALGLKEGMVVADIGAGTGLFTTEIAKRVGDTGAVYAVDIVPSFLEKIRERVKASELSNVRVVLGEERETKLAPGSVDLAFLCDTYHHIEYPKAYLSSLLQTMRPGARLVLIDLERIEGKTSADLMKHVRAGKTTVIAELSEAGFILESENKGLLEENYFLYFRRP